MDEWQRQARDAVRSVDDSGTSSTFSNGQNRMLFWVRTPYAANQARQALAGTTVPQEAVVFSVRPEMTLTDPPPQVTSPKGVALSLDFKSSIRKGQALLIEVVRRNEGDVAVEFLRGFPWDDPVWVITADGDEVWRRGGGGEDIGIPTRLEPGGELRLKIYWDLTDDDGFALPPGRYLLRAGADADLDLVTGPYELTIEP